MMSSGRSSKRGVPRTAWLGALLGFVLGGILGAVLGMVAGLIVGRMRAEIEADLGADGLRERAGPPAPEADHGAAFSVGAIVLAAKLAKVDGRVVEDEVLEFHRVFEVPSDEAKLVAELFDRARQDASGFEAYAERLGQVFAREPDLLEDLLAGLVRIARADGVVLNAERAFLAETAKRFGVAPARLEALLAA